MFQRTRTKVIAGVAAVALLGGAGFMVLVPQAQAALPGVTLFGSLDSTTGPTTVFPGIKAQAAGDWTTNPTEKAVLASTNSESWTMAITLDDVIPAVPAGPPGPLGPVLTPGTKAVPAKCKASSLTIGFSGTPVVTNTTVGNEGLFRATLTSSAACSGSGIKDILLINSTHAGAAGAVLTITGLTYDVGSGVAAGPVPYKVNEDAGFTTAVSNAVVSVVGAASADATKLIAPNKTSTIPNLVIQERKAAAITSGGVCVTLTDPADTVFSATSHPSAASSGAAGKGTPGPVTISESGRSLSFPVTLATTPAITTYTILGLSLTTGESDYGPVRATVTAGPCPAEEGPEAAVAAVVPTPPGQLFTPAVRLATVGGVGRLAGANRYATAAAIAGAQFDDLAGQTVVIARGDNFPDALAASYLAGQEESVILLVTPTSVPAETIKALKDLGVTDVVIVGGESAISPAVATAIAGLHTYPAGENTPNEAKITVSRVGGADRYQTAKLVAERPGLDAGGTIGVQDGTTCDDAKTAIVASGENFPDALAAGGLAYHGVGEDGCGSGPIPLLLTQRAGLTPTTVVALTELGIENVLLVGGPAAIDPVVENAIDALPGVSVHRIAGATRQDTAIALANAVLGPDQIGHWASGLFLVARPDTFPDALAASSLSGGQLAPLYLAASSSDLGTSVAKGIVAYPQTYGFGLLMGGLSALTNDVLNGAGIAIVSQP